MIETLVILAVLAGGYAFSYAFGIRGWGLPAIGYLSGLAILINVGFIQIVLGSPTFPIITVSLTLVLPLMWWILRGGWRDVSYWDAFNIALGALAVGLLVQLFRHVNLVAWSSDSLRYLQSAALIAGDNFDKANLYLLSARVFGVPLMHAPANLGGEFYLRAATPLLAISVVALLVWLFREGFSTRLGRYQLTIVAVAGTLLLVSNYRFIWHSFYLNGHLLCGAFALLIAGCGWLLAHRETIRSSLITPQTLVSLQALATPALVVTRPEGFLFAALLILPTVLYHHVDRNLRLALLLAFGASVTAWNLFLLFAYLSRNQEVPLAVLAPLALGLVAMCGAPLLGKRVLEQNLYRTLVMAELMLWVLLVAAAIRKPDILVASLTATFQNVVLGEGHWGYSLVLLALLVGLLSILSRAADLVFLRFPVTTFLPLVLILAYAREGAYRVGSGDSLNRMWMHIVPLAVLFVIAGAATLQPRNLAIRMVNERAQRASRSVC